MDKKTIESLRSAFEATPKNEQLFMVLLKAYMDAKDNNEANKLLREKTFPITEPEDQIVAGEIFLLSDDPESALKTCTKTTPEINLIRAKAYLLLNQLEEGMKLYKKAVTENPALKDRRLKGQLSGKLFEKTYESRDKKTKLKVISNDNTDETEVTRLLMPENRPVVFNDVGGLEGIKKQIHKKIILPFKKPSLFQRFKKNVGGGILLYGPPGCGKTLLARATAGECNAEFFNIAISDILDMYIGESERKLHAIFEKARNCKTAVIFFDEIEALGGKRQYTKEATSSKLVSQFLSEMDGFANTNSGVLVLGATNVPWAIDPAFRRPGRFDRVLFVPPPDKEARKRIIELHLQGRPAEDNIDINFISSQTSGFSGADIFNLVETVVDCAIEDSLESGQEVPLNMSHFKEAIKEVKPTTLEWLTTARNYARYANEGGQYDEVMHFLKKYGK